MAEASSQSVTQVLSSSSTTTLVLKPANQINSIKLNDNNFLLWNMQFLAGIRGLGLEIFILDDPPVPSKNLTDDAGTEIINPNFIFWCRQDQLLFSFLLASMTEEVQAQMIGCLTTTQLWSRVSCLFAIRSNAKVMHYKLHLQTLKKGSLTMKEYLGKMKNYVDLLAACGHSISEDDQVLHVLSGVGPEYDSVVVHVTSKTEMLSMVDVAVLLLVHVGRLESFSIGVDTSTSSVNAATFQPPKKPHPTSPQSGPPFRGRGRGRYTRGRGRGWHNNYGRPMCKFVEALVMLQRNVTMSFIQSL